MLQIKNTLGGGKPEGLYAWKKCVGTGVVKETPSTKKYYFTTSQSESATIYYSSSYTYDNGDFVLTNPSEINIGLGANNAIEADLYFMANTSRGNVMLKSSSGSNNQRTVIFNLKSGLYAHCPDSSYPFYICNDTYEFLDYIVSDKENAYPDGGEKGGYWYEKVSEGLTPEMFGCTKMAVDTYTPTSNIVMGNVTLNHSLGEIPRLVIIASNNMESYINQPYPTTLKLCFITNWNAETLSKYSCGALKKGSGQRTNYSENNSNITLDSSTLKGNENLAPGMYYLYVGDTYTIYTFA